MNVDEELVARALSAENVQRLLDGKIIGEPESGTLAHRIWSHREPRGFDTALMMLRAGLGVRRSGWNGSGLTVRMQVPDENSKMTLPYLYIEYPATSRVTPGARCPWVASQTDLMALDWEMVP